MLQQLFNSVDVAVVGRFASSEALAAIGSNTPIISLLINLFMGVSMGANAIISRHIGQNDKESIRRAINTVAFVAIISGCFLLLLGLVVARPILVLVDTPPEVLDMAVVYLRIYFLGMPFFMVFNFGSAILRSMGDTRRPLYILIAAGVVNTVLNLVFVIYFHLGVAGVAIATGIANAVSALAIVRLLLKEKEPYTLHLSEMKINARELSLMLQIGVPAGLQGMVFSISNVIVQSTINGYGTHAVAGSAAARNFELYCYFIIEAFNGAAISFIAQNYGAGNVERVRRIFWICMSLSVLFCGGMNWMFILGHEFFLNLFSTDPEVHRFAIIRMCTALAFQSIASGYEVAGSSLRGMGKSMLPTVFTIFGTCLLRVLWVYFVCPYWKGFDVLMAVYPMSWLLTGIMVVPAYYVVMCKWKKSLIVQGCMAER